MSKMSKGIRAFGIYFIVYAGSMFLFRVTSILSQIIASHLGRGASRYSYRCVSPYGLPYYTTFDAIVDFVGLALAVLAFFAALRIFKLSKLTLRSIMVVCLVGVGYNIAAIIKDVLEVFSKATEISFTSYKIAWGIAVCLLSIGLWCFVYYFFNRKSIKEQFS